MPEKGIRAQIVQSSYDARAYCYIVTVQELHKALDGLLFAARNTTPELKANALEGLSASLQCSHLSAEIEQECYPNLINEKRYVACLVAHIKNCIGTLHATSRPRRRSEHSETADAHGA